MKQTLVNEFVYKDTTDTLHQWSLLSRSLFNSAIDFLDNCVPTDRSIKVLDKHFKKSNMYKAFPKAQSAQQTLIVAIKAYKGYIEATKSFYKDPSKFTGKPELPKTENDDKPMTVIFTNQSSKIKNNEIILTKEFKIKLPQNFDQSYQQIRIKYISKNLYKIGIVYFKNVKDMNLDKNRFLSIDPGMSNLVSMVDSNGNAYMEKGNKLKIVINKYNYQAKNKKNKRKISNKRNNRSSDYIHKLSRNIVDYCIINNIGSIIIGNNKDWKRQSKMNHNVNRIFCGMAHIELFDKIKYKAELVGISVHVREESYTSKCDFLSNEDVKKHTTYLGSRIKRSLFQSGTGKIINADINGACNIFKKYIDEKNLSTKLYKSLLSKGTLFVPFNNFNKIMLLKKKTIKNYYRYLILKSKFNSF